MSKEEIAYNNGLLLGLTIKATRSDDNTKTIKGINVTRDEVNHISNVILTFDNKIISLDIGYNANGEITKVGETVINY